METTAVERLAQRLHDKAEHLDPSEDPGWTEMTERQRDFWRFLVADLLAFRALIERAWGEET